MINVNDDMQKPVEITEAAWRRRLTPDELARVRQHLAKHPEASPEWEGELALTRILNRLPSAPVSSNFTALVLEAARKTPARRGWWHQLDDWFPEGWRPRLGLGTAMVCLSLLTIREYQTLQRQRMARELVGSMASNQPVEWLKNFDAIKSFDRVEVADKELLEVLQ